MKKYFWSLLLAVIMAITGFAQQEVTVGDGASTASVVPLHTYYEYSVSQCLYLESEIGMTGAISSISYWPTSVQGDTRTIKIYMASTDKTGLASADDRLDFNDMTLVYEGTHTFVANSWNKFEFETPFTYAEGNLIVGIQDVTGAWSGYTYFKCDNKPSRTLGGYTDGSIPDPTYTRDELPQIQLEISELNTTCAGIEGTLSVSNLEAGSATISWTAIDGATYQYQYKTTTEDWGEEMTDITANTVDLSELIAHTKYNFRVRRYCSDDDVSYWKNVSFKTPCGNTDVELPWNYDFEVDNAIECWERPIVSTGTYSGFPKMLENYASGCYSGENCLEFKGSSDQMIVMPNIFGDDLTGLRLQFYYRINQTTIGTPQVGVMTDPNDPSTFTAIKTLAATGIGTAKSDWVYEKISLETAGEAKYIAFRSNGLGYSASWYIDDITVQEMPSCTGITGTLAVKEVTENSVTVEFVDDTPNHSAWKVYYKVSSDDEDSYDYISTTDKEVEIAPLEAATAYDVYVVTDCGSEDGELSNTVRVSTTAVPVAVAGSLSIDFEDEDIYNEHLQLSATSTTDGWKVGSFVKKDGKKALYMSQLYNTDGTAKEDNNDFTHRVYNHAYAIIPLTFGESAEQNISFDWKGIGQTASTSSWSTDNTVNYMSVYLVPSTVMIPEQGEITGDGVITVLDKKDGWGKNDWSHVSFITNDAKNATYSLVFYWKANNADQYPNYAANPSVVVDNILITSSDCASPKNLVEATMEEGEAIGSDFINVSWEQSGEVSSWNVYYRAVGSSEWDVQPASETTAQITGLSANTKYEVKVTSICDGEETVPVIGTFRTTCGDITIAEGSIWMDDFEVWDNANHPYCWEIIKNAPTGTGFHVEHGSTSLPYQGIGVMEFIYGDITVALPKITNIKDKNMRLRFYHKTTNSNTAGTVTIGVMTDLSDTNTFEPIYEVTPHQGTGSGAAAYTDEEIYLNNFNAEGDVYVVFKYIAKSNYTSWYFDNMTVDFIPSCPSISKKSVKVEDPSITAYTATVSFEDYTANDAWKVYYAPVSATVKEDTLSVTDIISGDTEGKYTAELTGLSADTKYNVWVVAMCSDEESEPSKTIQFRTSCAAITEAELPYINTFNAEDDAICWKIVTGNAGYYNNNLRVGGNAIIASPQFGENIQTLRVKFSYAGSSLVEKTLTIGLMSDVNDINTFEAIKNIKVTTTDKMYEIVAFDASQYTTGTGNYIAFKSGELGSYDYIYIDDVVIGHTPNCTSPDLSSVEVKNITHESATISFTDPKEANSSWKVYYKTDVADATISTKDVTAKEFTLTDLEQNTVYTIWIKTNCGDDEVSEDSTMAYTFRTKATPKTLPYNQDFEGENPESDFVFAKSGNDAWEIGTTYKKDGEKGMYVTWPSAVSSTRTATATVNVTFDDNPEHSISFDYQSKGITDTYYNTYMRVYLVPLDVEITSALPDSKYAISDEMKNAQDWTNFEYVSYELANKTMQLVFGWYNYTYAYGTQPEPSKIDNLSIVGNSCARPSDLTYTADESNINLTWTNNSEGSVKVNYKKASEDTYTSVDATGNTYTIPNLDSETDYNVYVSVDCGEGQTNQNTPIIATTTTNNYITITDGTYEIDFEDNTDYANLSTVQSGNNDWVVGTAANGTPEGETDDNHALYVSNNNGISWLYSPLGNNYSAFVSTYAVLPIKFANKNEYELSFDYKCGGGPSNADFSVYLVPANIQLSANTEIDKSVAKVLLDKKTSVNDWQNVITVAQGVAGGVYNLVFEWRYRDYSYYVNNPPAAVDNIKIEGFDCMRPKNLNYASVTDSSVVLSWTETGVTNSWTLLYGNNLNNMDSITVDATNSTINNNNVSYELKNLKAGAMYYCQVKAICGTKSQPTETINFNTLGKRVKNFPYFLHFENADSNNVFTMSGSNINQFYIGDATGVIDQYGDGWTQHCLYVSNDGGESFKWQPGGGSPSAKMSVQFGDEDEYSIGFDYIATGHESSTYLKVSLVNENGQEVEILPVEKRIGIYSWKHYECKLPYTDKNGNVLDVRNGLYDLVFTWIGNSGGYNMQPGTAIDNISIVGSSCSSVTDLRVDKGHKMYTNSLPVQFYDPNPDHTSWTVEYAEKGQVPNKVVIEDTSILLENLSSGINYQIKVYANCISEEDTTLSVPTYLSVYTDCSPVAAGWGDDFSIEKYDDRALPICWTRILSDSGQVYYGMAPFPSIITYAGTGHDILNTTNGKGDPTSMEFRGRSIIATPYFENIETTELIFWIMNGTVPNGPNRGVWIYVADDIWDTTTWEPVKLIRFSEMGTSNYLTYGDGDGVHIDCKDIISKGTKAFIISYFNDNAGLSWFYMDDFRLLTNDGESDCENNVTISLTDGEVNEDDGLLYAADENTATVTWTTTGAEKKWDYKLGLHSFWTTTTDSTATFNNLTAGTENVVYVRSYCMDIVPKYDENESIIGYDTVETGKVSPWKALTFTTAGDNPLYCPVVTNVVQDSVSDSTVSISWEIDDTYATGGVDIMITKDDNPQYNAYDGHFTTVTTGNNITFSQTSEGYKLEQLTTYNVYIRSHCAQSTSDWDTLHVTTAKAFLKPIVTTKVATVNETTSATGASATLSGMVDKKDATISEKGFVYWETSAPAYTTQTVVSTDATATFTSTVNDLKPLTGYGYYAYAKTEEDTVIYKGSTQTFTTNAYIPAKPVISEVTLSNITPNGATFTATFTPTSETLVEKGFAYYEDIDNAPVQTVVLNGNETSAAINTLSPYTKYKVYAYAKTAYYTNGVFGDTNTFQTESTSATVINPEVEALVIAANELDSTSVVLRGNIVSEGQNVTITKIGFAYNEKGSTTVDTVTLASTTEEFKTTVTNLKKDYNYEYVAWVETQTTRIHSAKIDFHTAEGVFFAPVVTTLDADAIDSTHATLHGTIVQGSQTITARGFLYIVENATDSINKIVTGEDMSAALVNLTKGTTYKFRAYAKTSTDTYYGEEKSFTTTQGETVYPIVQTYDATTVTSTGATLNGRVTETDASITVTEKGFAYKVKNSADVEVEQPVSATTDQFSFNVSGLNGNTTYVYYTYAKVTDGEVIKGEDKEFTTLEAVVVNPTVVTGSATSTQTTITLNGTVTKGDKDLTAAGFNYRVKGSSDWQSVTATLNNKTMSATVQDLQTKTEYEYQAYVTTEDGTFTGSVLSIVTLADGALNDAESSVSVVTYPNPTTDDATLEVKGLTSDAKVVVTDIQGRILINDVLPQGETTITINTANLPSGVYYIKVINDQINKTQTLIKK